MRRRSSSCAESRCCKGDHLRVAGCSGGSRSFVGRAGIAVLDVVLEMDASCIMHEAWGICGGPSLSPSLLLTHILSAPLTASVRSAAGDSLESASIRHMIGGRERGSSRCVRSRRFPIRQLSTTPTRDSNSSHPPSSLAFRVSTHHRRRADDGASKGREAQAGSQAR